MGGSPLTFEYRLTNIGELSTQVSRLAMDNPTLQSSRHGATAAAIDHSAWSECKSFVKGAEYCLVQDTYDGVRQELGHSGVTLAPRHFSDKPSNFDAAGRAGDFAGEVAKFWLVSQAAGKVTGIGALRAASTWKSEGLKMGLTGSMVAATTPVSEHGHFARDKSESVIEGLGSMATFGAVNGASNEIGLLGRAGYRTCLGDGAVYGFSGAISGVAGEEIHSLMTGGEGMCMSSLGKMAATNAVLGFGLAGIERLRPVQAIKFQAITDGAPTSTVSTEDWAAVHYDGKKAIRSPILTWLAEHKPELRPANYAELKAAAWQDKGAVSLSLGDWAPQERRAVLAELRRMGQKDLVKDSNIDAFISRFAQPKLQAAAEQYAQSVKPVEQAYDDLDSMIGSRSEFAGRSAEELMDHAELSEKLKLPENRDLLAQVNKIADLQGELSARPEEATLQRAIQTQYDALNAEFGLPSLKAHVHVGQDASTDYGSLFIGMGETPSISAETVERGYHEFTHHAQGFFKGAETLKYVAKLPYYIGANLIGLRDSLPALQNTSTRELFLNSYVGSSIEKQAYATGFLARLRSLAAGLPSDN